MEIFEIIIASSAASAIVNGVFTFVCKLIDRTDRIRKKEYDRLKHDYDRLLLESTEKDQIISEYQEKESLQLRDEQDHISRQNDENKGYIDW